MSPLCAVKSVTSLTHLYPGIGTEVMEQTWFFIEPSDAIEHNHIISRILASYGHEMENPIWQTCGSQKGDWDSLVEKHWSGSL